VTEHCDGCPVQGRVPTDGDCRECEKGAIYRGLGGKA